MGPFYLYIQALKASAEMFSLLEEEESWRVGLGAPFSHPATFFLFF